MAPWPICLPARGSFILRRVSTKTRSMEAALEAGAEDIEASDDGSVDVTHRLGGPGAVRQALEEAGLTAEDGEVTMIAATTVPVDADGAEKLMGLVDALEDLDDVQNVYTNVDIPDEVLASL